MSITPSDVRNISKLANINVLENEVDFIANELNSIINWVEQLNEVDIYDVDLRKIAMESMPEREDMTEKTSGAEIILKNAPDRMDAWFAVPKIIG
jgi:aspartyl-tRNA(Asn)/glutamyl-tRNA(Gln) amidotransferase subunit C